MNKIATIYYNYISVVLILPLKNTQSFAFLFVFNVNGYGHETRGWYSNQINMDEGLNTQDLMEGDRRDDPPPAYILISYCLLHKPVAIYIHFPSTILRDQSLLFWFVLCFVRGSLALSLSLILVLSLSLSLLLTPSVRFILFLLYEGNTYVSVMRLSGCLIMTESHGIFFPKRHTDVT